MQQSHVTWAKWAAGVTLFAGADMALGTGAVQALAELCLTDTAYEPQMPMPGMPMEHGGHALPLLFAGSLFASVAGFGSWSITRRAQRGAWAPARRAVLAGLVLVAKARGGASAEDIADTWNTALDPAITPTDAKIALARFGALSPTARSDLIGSLKHQDDRAALICMGLRLVRGADPSGAGFAMLETIAEDMGMDGLEIATHWEAREAPSRAAVAVGEARALGVIAARAAFSKIGNVFARLAPPLADGASAMVGLARSWGRAALIAFVRALASPSPPRVDDQLKDLRRRFRRRGLRPNFSNLNLTPRAPFRRGTL